MGLNEMPRMDLATFRALTGEFIATFTFLFIAMATGCTLVASGASDPAIGGIAVAFAAVAVIYSFGGLSGAHFNPAVTFGSIVGLRMNAFKGIMYIAVQVLAAFMATGILMYLYPDKRIAEELTLGLSQSKGRAVLIEMLMTFFLVMTIYATALGKAPTVRKRREMEQEGLPVHASSEIITSSREAQLTIEHENDPVEGGTYDPNKPFAGLAIAFMLGCLCYVGGMISGGGFNPARATAPAVLSGKYKDLWVFWAGDFAGAALAAIVYNLALG